jgi:hypothetical protein
MSSAEDASESVIEAMLVLREGGTSELLQSRRPNWVEV